MDVDARGLDERLLRQLCRQMQDITHVCEGLALKLLDLEARVDQLGSSVEAVSVAVESEELACLLDAVGGRLVDLKGLLGVEAEVAVVEQATDLRDFSVAETASLDGVAVMEMDEGVDAANCETADCQQDASTLSSDLETVYVDDPQIDLLSA